MDEKIQEKLRKQCTKNRELVRLYRKKLDIKLQKMCIKHGGHLFWSWQEAPAWSIGGHLFYSHQRRCQICKFSEYKTDDKYKD